MADETNFETKFCTRCGGNGLYSYTPRYGSTCFKCGGKPFVPGTGRILTAAGAKARAAWQAANSVEMTAADFREGDRVFEGARRWTVVSVETGDFGASISNGVRTPYTIRLEDRSGIQHVYPADHRLTRWVGDFDGPPKAPANTDRAKEMRAYVKAAEAFAAARKEGVPA